MSEFTTGEYKSFEIPHGYTEMCFYTHSLGQCQDTDDFLALAVTQNRKQHPEDYTVNFVDASNIYNSNRTVNFRMLEPDQALDEAFAIRLYNETVVYFVTNHSCMDSLYSAWTPVLFIYKDEDSMPPCNYESVTTTSPSSTVTGENNSYI